MNMESDKAGEAKLDGGNAEDIEIVRDQPSPEVFQI
jgi:hypothetical protein